LTVYTNFTKKLLKEKIVAGFLNSESKKVSKCDFTGGKHK